MGIQLPMYKSSITFDGVWPPNPLRFGDRPTNKLLVLSRIKKIKRGKQSFIEPNPLRTS